MTLTVLPHAESLDVRPGELFIDGQWTSASDGSRWTHRNPATNEEITTIALATAEDGHRAVAAARRAFDKGPWPRMQARERKRLLQPLVDRIYDHADELSRLQTLDNAIPLQFSTSYRISGEFAADVFDYNLGWIDKLNGETYPQYTERVPFQFVSVHEPVGVVAAITPWNAPLVQFPEKVAPALAAGCTLVIKPSEYASLTALRLSQLIAELDLPPGVFNVLTGIGPTVGEALITDPAVDKIAFTGSRRVGSRVLEASADRIARTTLELGGKSASIIFPDVPDLAAASSAAMGMVSMGLSGQVCSAQTRALVHADIYDEFLELAAQQVSTVRFGDPFDLTTTSSPLINKQQLDKVLTYIQQGQEEGAELVFGGDRPDGDLADGNWVNPTLFADVDHSTSISRDEIFGPVLAAVPFHNEDEAIRIANDSVYGLSAGVYTGNVARAWRVARALRTGTVGVNGYTFMPNSPFGGFKQSGMGREGGWQSVEAYLETKSIMFGLEH